MTETSALPSLEQRGGGVDADAVLVVDLDGFEGPLDLLLDLARRQKVDMARLSVARLAEQYVAYMRAAQGRRLDIASDYLIMAAWLTYLKSRLLLPATECEDDPCTAEEEAAALAFRLRRLDAMRRAAEQLMERPQLDREFFRRGMPENIPVVTENVYEATLYQLLKAYGKHNVRRRESPVRLVPRAAWPIAEARETLLRLVGEIARWTPLSVLLAGLKLDRIRGRSVVASGFSAALELARQGHITIVQSSAYEPLYVSAAGTPDHVRGER